MLKEDLGMRYKKVHPVALHANSEKNLVLRQRFAMVFLDIMLAGKRVVNLDESWLGASDFRCRKWCPKDSRNSVAKLQLQPRISMICGVDTDGHLYLSLVQANNNSKVFGMFLRQLVRKLDAENAAWRADTVILMDNAPYHKDKATLKLLCELKVPICYTGTHSYDASPVELLFAAFKSKDINPRHLKTGKRLVHQSKMTLTPSLAISHR